MEPIYVKENKSRTLMKRNKQELLKSRFQMEEITPENIIKKINQKILNSTKYQSNLFQDIPIR